MHSSKIVDDLAKKVKEEGRIFISYSGIENEYTIRLDGKDYVELMVDKNLERGLINLLSDE